MKKLSAGIIGMGFGEFHIQLLSQIESVSIDWLCYQSNKSKAERIAQEYNISNITSNYKDVTRSGVDFVVVVTPVYTHFEISKDAIEAGKHVVSDKPLAMNQHECRELIKLAEDRQVKNMTFFQWRFNNLLMTLKEILDKKEIGEIYSFSSNFYTDFMADDSIPYLWRHDKNRGGMGVSTDMGVHLIDLIYWLTNGDITIENVASKSAYPFRKIDEVESIQVTTEDFSTIQYNLKIPTQTSSAIGTITMCRTAHGFSKIELMILGTKGSVLVEIDPFTAEGNVFMNNKLIQPAHNENENPYYHWSNYLLGKDTLLPSFQDGLKSQIIIDVLSNKTLK